MTLAATGRPYDQGKEARLNQLMLTLTGVKQLPQDRQGFMRGLVTLSEKHGGVLLGEFRWRIRK